MSTRTTQSVITFASQFWLHGLEAPMPPGSYRVEDEEESIDGSSWVAYRRVATFLHLPAIGIQTTTRQMIKVERTDLEAAQHNDSASSIIIFRS